MPKRAASPTPGENFSFAIMPGEGHHIADVLINDESIGAAESYEFTNVTENFTIHATFAINVYVVNAVTNNPDFGTVTGAGSYEHFEEVTLTATSETGYHFINWTEDGVEITTDDTYSFMAESDRDLVAHFAINVYTISALPNNPDWGDVQGAGDYEHGQDVTLEAIPATNYVFVRWTENDEEISDVPDYNFTALSPRSLMAHFDPEVSVTDMISNEVIIYPNPFKNSITISNALSIDRVLINNIIGQVVLEKTLSGSEQETISTENLHRGIYLITLIDNHGYRQVRKMVKE